MKHNFNSYLQSSEYKLDLIRIVFRKKNITFSKTVAARLVGGESRLEKLVLEGKIEINKPAAKQNGKWYCNGVDVIDNIRL